MIRPRLRIKLISPASDVRLLLYGIEHRPDGSDRWEVKVTYTSSEGAIDIQRFKSVHKGKALHQAYAFIKEKSELEAELVRLLQLEMNSPPTSPLFSDCTSETYLLPEKSNSPGLRWWQLWRKQ